MKRAPLILILALVAMWLLLNNTLSAGQAVLGIVLALIMVLGFRNLRPLQPHLRRPRAAIQLTTRVLLDIVRSNVAVARVILGLTGRRTVRSGFVDIRLDLRDPHGLAVLAAIVTSTPGTVWAGLTPDRGTLTLHVLDLKDELAVTHTIKERYERLLLEVFE